MATRTFDYSKWDNIELSDDEGDLHPNIDKDSWFRMKHRTRLEREQKEDAEMAEHDKLTQEDGIRLKVLATRIARITKGQTEDEDADDVEALQGEVDDLRARIAVREKRRAEISERRAWNIDNIARTKEERSLVNANQPKSLTADAYNSDEEDASAATASSGPAPAASVTASVGSAKESKPSAKESKPSANEGKSVGAVSKGPLSKSPSAAVAADPAKRERFSAMSYNDYAIAHEALLEKYSDMASLEETKDFLFKHCDTLLHEHAQSYMLLSCLEDEMNGKHERMRLVCRQSQILSHIHELGASLKRDPRDVILPFFARISQAEYMKGFLQAVGDFTQRIRERAVVKRKEMDEEGAPEPRLGPGGLDPRQVLGMLPADLQSAFESQSVQRLHDVLAAMEPKDAKRYMKLCVDSGLWVPQDESVFANEDEFPPDSDDEDKGVDTEEGRGA